MSTTGRTTAAIAALLALGVLYRPVGVWAVRSGASPRALAPLLVLWRTGANAEDRAASTRGYYQGLLDESGGAVRRGLLGMRLEDAATRKIFETHFHARRLDDFLFYDLPPDLDVVGAAGHVRTNAFGLCDGPYELDKAPGVRRALLLGSSIARGAGVPPGAAYEALLERRLDGAHRPPGVQRVEILNFAVDGYRPTQMLHTALERCPPFQPDLYVWEMSSLFSREMWWGHVAALVESSVDLRYPILRDLVREVGVSRYDPFPVKGAKLAPHGPRILRWILETVRDHARASGAELVVLFVPLVDSPEAIAHDFAGMDELVAELGILAVDARDAFAGVDLAAVRCGPADRHPNEAGHRTLAERIEVALLAEPELLALFTGP